MRCRLIFREITSSCDGPPRVGYTYIEPILLGRKDEVGKQKLGQDPEQFVNQYLIWPICEAAGLDYISEWFHEGHGGSIDLYIRNTDQPIFGECKRLNHYKRAIKDLREYLQHRTAQTQYGIATDGISWLFIRKPEDQRKTSKCSNTTHSEAPSLRLSFQSTPSSHNSKLNECSGTPLSGKQPTLRTSSTGNSIENPSTNPSRYSKQILTQ